MGKSSAPKAPDPAETASAQTATNVGTAVANSYLGNVNQQTPYGSLTYNQTGSQKWTDPTSGKTYDLPTFTATQALSGNQQAISDQNEQANKNLATLAATQSGKLNDILGTPFSTAGAPAAGNASSLAAPSYTQFSGGPQLQTSVGNTGNIQNSIADAGNISNSIANAGDITKSYGTDYAQNVQQVQDGLMSRLQPTIDTSQKALETKLANQGITYGSPAYSAAMDDFNRGVNDQRTSVLLSAGQEQSRLAGLAANQAAFQNSAQAQQYSQNANDASFGNSAQGQQFSQNQAQQQANNTAQNQAYTQAMSNAQLGNTANQQMYQNANTTAAGNNALADQSFNSQQAILNAQNTARANYLNEQYAARNQPINEISSLLNGSQVTQPNFVSTQGQSIPTVDYAGLINQNYQNQLSAYNTQQAQNQSLFGGLLGLGAAGIMASDKRVKKDIKQVGTVKGHKVYEYAYKGELDDGNRHIGVMAQDVEKTRPDVVVTGSDGVKRVNYGKLLDMGSNLSKKRAA